ncbi:MAG: Steroid C27-monooxygenase [Frankiales bacterium]|jgi:cholest-4-en-3-one 26-monooxygenase|nr:Steroid C27-monooxygenase [Frankiales bacterium]
MTAPVDKADRPRCPVDIDLIDPDTFADGLPLEQFAAMRESAPVFWHDQPGSWGDGFWVVTRHADVQEVSRTPEVFSSYERGALLHTGEAQDEEQTLEMTRMLMLNMDPPEHSQYRNIVQRAFTPRVIKALEPRLQEFAADIVDRALAKGEGDFVKDVAAELPLLAICELLGVPAEDRSIIFDLSNRLIGFDDPEFRTSADDAQVASMEMYMYADGIAAARRECPADDIATKLLQAEVDGGALTQEQFDVFFLLLSVAGNETTRNSITHGMQAFFDHPDQWEIFKRERPLATAVDEIIRWATPVIQFQRTALSDYQLGGQTISKGDRVAIYYSAANRDDAALESPDTFDVTRENNDHVAFGGGGPHFCLGANLARATVRIMFNEIAERMPDIRPLGPPRTLRSMFINGIKEIPVSYS